MAKGKKPGTMTDLQSEISELKLPQRGTKEASVGWINKLLHY